MTDDLVERLLNCCQCNIDSTPCGAEDECRAALEAVDRIKALEKLLAEAAANRAAEYGFGEYRREEMEPWYLEAREMLGWPGDYDYPEELARRRSRSHYWTRLNSEISAARRKALEEAELMALTQRCERDTAWDNACVTIAHAIRALKEKE